MQRYLAFLTAAAAIYFTGCAPKYPECKADPDCAEHQEVCVSGFCKQCREDKNCKEGFICRANACVPKPQCTKKEDCPSGQKCEAEKCVAECTAATAEKDCGAGKRCLANGACGGPDDCSGDADCSDGKVCQNGKCAVKQITCGQDEDCPANAACVNGVCQVGAARKVKCHIESVHFDFDKFNIKPNEKKVLDDDIQCLQTQGAKTIKVEGHCDERGTTEYNLALGNRRASSVRKYMSKAAPGITVQTESFGEERPIDPGHDEAAWAKNRRAEIVPEK